MRAMAGPWVVVSRAISVSSVLFDIFVFFFEWFGEDGWDWRCVWKWRIGFFTISRLVDKIIVTMGWEGWYLMNEINQSIVATRNGVVDRGRGDEGRRTELDVLAFDARPRYTM